MCKTADCQDTQETQTSPGQQLGSADVHQDGFDSKPVTLRPWPLVRLPLPARLAAGSCPWCCHALSRINEHMPPGTAGVYLALLPINPANEKSGRSAPHWLGPRLRPFMPPHASKAATAPALSQEERSRLTPTFTTSQI